MVTPDFQTKRYTHEQAPMIHHAPYKMPQDCDRGRGEIMGTTIVTKHWINHKTRKSSRKSNNGAQIEIGMRFGSKGKELRGRRTKDSGRRVRQCCACVAHAPLECLRHYARKIRSPRRRQGNEPIIMPWVPTPDPLGDPDFSETSVPENTNLTRQHATFRFFRTGRSAFDFGLIPWSPFASLSPKIKWYSYVCAPLGFKGRNLFAFPGSESLQSIQMSWAPWAIFVFSVIFSSLTSALAPDWRVMESCPNFW